MTFSVVRLKSGRGSLKMDELATYWRMWALQNDLDIDLEHLVVGTTGLMLRDRGQSGATVTNDDVVDYIASLDADGLARLREILVLTKGGMTIWEIEAHGLKFIFRNESPLTAEQFARFCEGYRTQHLDLNFAQAMKIHRGNKVDCSLNFDDDGFYAYLESKDGIVRVTDADWWDWPPRLD
jgi:hypothetical protein